MTSSDCSSCLRIWSDHLKRLQQPMSGLFLASQSAGSIVVIHTLEFQPFSFSFSAQDLCQKVGKLFYVKSCVLKFDEITPKPVADPGFSRGGGVNPPGGAWTRQIFPKTAWNRKNLDAQGGACVPHAPPRSANANNTENVLSICKSVFYTEIYFIKSFDLLFNKWVY